jgi:hypothetical protein
LRPGGELRVLDVWRAASLRGFVVSAFAMLVDPLRRLIHTGRFRPVPEVRRAWREHGRTDRYVSIEEVIP